MIDLTPYNKIRIFTEAHHDIAGCEYDGQSYMTHIDMVVENLGKRISIFKTVEDADNAIKAAYGHDLVEDARLTYNDILKVFGKESADIILALTDVPGENRLMRHILTMPKQLKDYRALIVKMCDIYSNASYSKMNGSSMSKKYTAEYAYRRPIFKMALEWYKDKLNQEPLEKFWNDLDELYSFKN